MCTIHCGCFALAHAQQCGLVLVPGSLLWLRCKIVNSGSTQVLITATIALMDAAFSPCAEPQTIQECPVSPRVIWTSALPQHSYSNQKRGLVPASWSQWALEQYAWTCRGLPAIVHLLTVLGVTFYTNLWAACVNLRSIWCFQ